MSIHDEHRMRVRKRFLEEGLDHFEEHQVLEMLLFYVYRRGDTNEIAHKLVDRFGGIAGVLDADPKELETVKGIGPESALFLNLLSQVFRFYQVSLAKREDVILRTIEDCGRHLVPYFRGRTLETVYVLCLDAKCKVICCKEAGEGSINCASVSVRKVVEIAIQNCASSVVLAHNHPSGVAIPSDEDILTTRRIALALSTVDIILADHIIVAEGDFVSLAQSGLYNSSEYRALV